MEDFHIFTVNDTTDSSLEEYNSENEIENDESNVFLIFSTLFTEKTKLIANQQWCRYLSREFSFYNGNST